MKSGNSVLRTKLGITLVAVVVAFMGSTLMVQDAQAQSRAQKRIKKLVADAMENYDLMEFEDAKKGLSKAIVHAKINKVAKKKFMAYVHVRLAVVYFAGLNDKESAKLEFINAVELDKTVQIPAVYKTGTMAAALNSVRKEFGGKSSGSSGSNTTKTPEPGPSVDCDALSSMAHTMVDEAPSGSSKKLMAHVSGKLRASKVVLHYRSKGAANFTKVKMGKLGECSYAGTIPGKAVHGEFLHYYIAAYNKKGKQIARKGSSGSPNVIEVIAAVSSGGTSSDGGGTDTENPLGDGGGSSSSGSSGGTVKKSLSRPSKSSVFLSVAVGTGAGYVTGTTEQQENEVGCCVAPALFHLFPEIGYFTSPKTSISLAFRLGFTVGANIEGHSTGAPAALLRLRHALSEDGNGLQVSAAIGGGIIRHTVKLSNADAAMDTDTTATGPVFIGAGAAYAAPISGSLKFVLEVNAIAGLPVVSEFGGVKPNFALHVDMNMGFMLGF